VGSGVTTTDLGRETFSHEAALYRGPEDLARVAVPFLREGIDRGEPVLVALVREHSRVLEQALGADAARVEFVDMADLGANPACIIPAWRRFLADTSGPVRGVGEPIWAGRREVELGEAELHESLLNVAFDDGRGWRLMCPYDVTSLPDTVVSEALRNHPVAHAADGERPSYAGHRHARELFAEPLPVPPGTATTLPFGFPDLSEVRSLLHRYCNQTTLESDRANDLVLAAHELASNSVRHAGGGGVISVWTEPDAVVVDVRDAGTIEDPLVGRGLPDEFSENGRGIWMANQLCDLVQVRSRRGNTQVRLHAWL
jgi:anti-sigma regulatory factor (Ser/Thr protein kinase)